MGIAPSCCQAAPLAHAGAGSGQAAPPQSLAHGAAAAGVGWGLAASCLALCCQGQQLPQVMCGWRDSNVNGGGLWNLETAWEGEPSPTLPILALHKATRIAPPFMALCKHTPPPRALHIIKDPPRFDYFEQCQQTPLRSQLPHSTQITSKSPFVMDSSSTRNCRSSTFLWWGEEKGRKM